MRKVFFTFIVATIVLLSASCERQNPPASSKLTNLKDSASYAMGIILAQQYLDEQMDTLMNRDLTLNGITYLMKNDTEQIWKLDGDFHKIIYDASRSRPLRFTLSNFHNYIKKARDISVQTEGRAEKTVAEHRAILDAIREHNGDLAEQLTAQHISNAEVNLFENVLKTE